MSDHMSITNYDYDPNNLSIVDNAYDPEEKTEAEEHTEDTTIT